MESKTPFFYETEVTWVKKRKAEVRSQGLPDLSVAPPREFAGPGDSWTPEHLYVAALTSCFMITFLAIAENSKLELVSFSVSGKGKLEKVDKVGYQFSEVILQPRLVIRLAQDMKRAERILEKAKKSCVISNSVASQVRMEPELYHQASQTVPCPSVP